MTEAAFLCLSAIFMTTLTSSNPAFVLEGTPPKMTSGHGLSLECSSKGGGHDLPSASWIRITRKIGRSWSTVAELRDFDSCVGVDQAAPGRDEVSAAGHLGNGDDTYLKLSWKSADLNVVGQYRCELVGRSGDGGILVISTPSISVTGDAIDDYCQTPDSAKLSSLGSKVDELSSLVRSIYERQTSLMQSVDRIQDSLLRDGQSKDTLPQDGQSKDTLSQDGLSNDTLSQDGHSEDTLSQDSHSKDTLSRDAQGIDKLSMDVHSEVVLLLRDQLANFSFVNLKWNVTPPTAERYPDERSQFAESVTVSDVVVTPAPPLELLQQWPGGSYALPVPETGCPENTSDVFWRETFTTHHVESDTEIPAALDANHVATPLYEIRGSNRFVFFRLCRASGRIADDNVWPKGAYCISRVESLCPDGGFTSGYVQLDNENNETEGMDSEFEADVALSEGVTRLHFCCRQDGDHSVPLSLPTQHPFYLYMYGGECQSVADMKVTQETFIFDTEDEDNKDSYENDAHPDGRLNDVHIRLCYYEKDVAQP